MTTILESTEDDLPAIAVCHNAAFPLSLSTAMGVPFLTRMLSWYLSNDHAFLFHIQVEGKVVGYCGGVVVDGTQATGSASGMAQHSFQMAIVSFARKPWLLFHGEVRKKYKLILRNILLKSRLIKARPKSSAVNNDDSKHVGLVVIGVDPAFQGKGFSNILLDAFEKKGRVLGAKTLRLTVLPDNTRAIAAYKKNGWQEFTKSENTMSMYKNISK